MKYTVPIFLVIISSTLYTTEKKSLLSSEKTLIAQFEQKAKKAYAQYIPDNEKKFKKEIKKFITSLQPTDRTVLLNHTTQCANEIPLCLTKRCGSTVVAIMGVVAASLLYFFPVIEKQEWCESANCNMADQSRYQYDCATKIPVNCTYSKNSLYPPAFSSPWTLCSGNSDKSIAAGLMSFMGSCVTGSVCLVFLTYQNPWGIAIQNRWRFTYKALNTAINELNTKSINNADDNV
ncbi:MAG TPA: hypothetical protein VEK38_01865 [Candidatus Bathyarchaeia archaeon]|nr:hypothetical protein [Candidatus Bathyarchaeia archaeon]